MLQGSVFSAIEIDKNSNSTPSQGSRAEGSNSPEMLVSLYILQN